VNLTRWTDRLQINHDALHLECSEQADLYASLGTEVAQLRSEARRTKAMYELTKSEVRAAVRANPVNWGLVEKATVPDIDATVTRASKVLQTFSDYLAAQQASDAAEILLKAFDHRRTMLSKLVDLWLARYYGEGQMANAVAQGAASQVEEKIMRMRRERK